MGQRTEELTTEIEQTRESLASDLDALQDRVSPSAIMDRRKAAARDRWEGMRSRVMGTASSAHGTVSSSASGVAGSVSGTAQGAVGSVRDAGTTAQRQVQGSPLGAGLVAFGAGLVISSLLPASHREAQAASQLLDVAQDKAQPLVEEAKEAARSVGQDVAQNAGEAAQQVKETATDSASRVTEEGRSAADSVKEDAQGA